MIELHAVVGQVRPDAPAEHVVRDPCEQPGVDAETFRRIAEATRKGCPVSAALAGVDIRWEAELE